MLERFRTPKYLVGAKSSRGDIPGDLPRRRSEVVGRVFRGHPALERKAVDRDRGVLRQLHLLAMEVLALRIPGGEDLGPPVDKTNPTDQPFLGFSSFHSSQNKERP